MTARTPSLALAALLFLVSAASAQDWDSDGHGPPPTWHVNFAIHNTGLSIGNSTTFTGLRLNWRDYRLDRIHGINVTLWKPGDHVGGEITGVATGLFGPGVGRLRGLAVGPLAVIAEDGLTGIGVSGLAVVTGGRSRGIALAGLATVAGGSTTGISVGGLALVTGGDTRGLNVGGLAVVGGGDVTGLNVGGLAIVSGGRLHGINLGGLAAVSGDGMRGLNVGGLATVSGKELVGINVSGLATVSGQDMRGINVGGLAVVSGQDLRWINIGGLAVVGGGRIDGVSLSAGAVETGSLRGLAVGGYRVKAREAQGFIASALYTRTRYLTGVAVAPYNRVRTLQVGLAIGVVNDATELHGVQVGLINIARNNRGWNRVLPVLNLHL
jgi:hypothetical protein